MIQPMRSRWHTELTVILAALCVATGAIGSIGPSRAGATPPATPQASPAASDNPYAREFADARERATSDFERGVLADDLITHAEYAEAVDRFITCMHDAGFDVVAVPSPDVPGMWWYESRIPDVSMASTPATEAYLADQNEAFDRCSTGTTFQIESLYHAILTNPTNADPATLSVECMKLTGLAKDDYTTDDFTENFAQEGGTFPFEVADARFGSCINNPNQTGLPWQMVAPDPRMLPANATPTASPTA
ncbi:MAG: hypothetical protein QM753_18210 [Thermomicrobiales bacterium]